MIISSPLTETWLPLLVAALIQAGLALGVGLLSLLSGHALASKSNKKQKLNLNKLSISYILGYFLVTLSSLANLSYLFLIYDGPYLGDIWVWLSVIAILVGYVVLMFYYRRGNKGTQIWLPRGAAEYLFNRTRKVKSSFEAFLLGSASVLAEFVFAIVPLTMSALIISVMTTDGQLIGILIYSLVATSPLVVIWLMQSTGGKLSAIQTWREKNKIFLQVVSGAMMILLGSYLLIQKVFGALSWQ